MHAHTHVLQRVTINTEPPDQTRQRSSFSKDNKFPHICSNKSQTEEKNPIDTQPLTSSQGLGTAFLQPKEPPRTTFPC